MIFWSHNDFLSRHAVPMQYEFIVVGLNVQTTISAFHKVVSK